MKRLRFLLLITAMLAVWQLDAAEFTGAKLMMTTPNGEMAFDLPVSGFQTADYTAYGKAESLVVNSFEVFLNNADDKNVSDVTMHVAMYKQGNTPSADNWMEIPLQYIAGGSWGITLDKNLAEEAGDGGNFVLELYVTADNSGTQLALNNGGENYKVLFALGKSGGDSSDNVRWLKSGAAELFLYNGEDYLQYRYSGDGTRDNSTMPGSLDMLAVNSFSLYYDLADGVRIVDASLQYMIYPEGSDAGMWNGISCEDVSTLVSSHNNTYRSTMSQQTLISRDLAPGNYVLRVMYQLIDQNGKYYFFGKDNSEFVFYFSVNEPKDPDILGLSMVITPTPGEQQYPWLEKGESYEPFDLTAGEPLTSMTVDEAFVFVEGNFEYLTLLYEVIGEGGAMYAREIPLMLDDFGNWSNEESTELLREDILEAGKEYKLEFYVEGVADGEMYTLKNNDGERYKVLFKFAGDGGVKGDLNGDDAVNSGDISALYQAILNNDNDPLYDINGDGEVNSSDVSLIYSIILE